MPELHPLSAPVPAVDSVTLSLYRPDAEPAQGLGDLLRPIVAALQVAGLPVVIVLNITQPAAVIAAAATSASPSLLAKSPEPRREPGCEHSPDFRCVTWRGARYDFSTTQALIIAALWEAWERGTPAVSQEYLLESCDRPGRRLRDLFKLSANTIHPAWGVMIIPGTTRGTYQLA